MTNKASNGRWPEDVEAGLQYLTSQPAVDRDRIGLGGAGLLGVDVVTTLIKTPAHAPADGIAAADILNKLQTPGGAAVVIQQLTEARRADPEVQLFPEISAGIVGADYRADPCHLRLRPPRLAAAGFCQRPDHRTAEAL